jgi:hypothetical protein
MGVVAEKQIVALESVMVSCIVYNRNNHYQEI